MPLFIMALNIVSDARKEHPNLAQQINESFDLFTANKTKVRSLFATLGRYDYIAVFEADDQTIAFRIASQISGRGVLETETWPVIPYEDFSQLIK